MFALSIFPGRPSIVPALEQSGGLFQPQKSPDLSIEALCSRYLFSQVGQCIVLAVKKHAGGMF